MNRSDVLALLKSRGIPFELVEHKAVYNMADLAEIALPHPEADAKNLFVRDDKRQSFYLITVKGEKRVDLKAFRHAHGTRPLSFASDEELAALIEKTFDFRPAAIIERLDLRRPIYQKVATYGHFGRDDLDLTWEKLDCVDKLKNA